MGEPAGNVDTFHYERPRAYRALLCDILGLMIEVDRWGLHEPSRIEMLVTLAIVGRIFLKCYAVFLLTAVGGFLGAQFAGLAGALLLGSDVGAASPWSWAGKPLSWNHVGWIGGTLIAFFGAVTGRLRFLNGASADAGAKAKSVGSAAPTPLKEIAEDGRSEEVVLVTGPIKTIASLTLIGSLVGVIAGASLVVPWFSIAQSPFAPKGWHESIKVEQQRVPGSSVKRNVHTSSHPLVIKLFLYSAALGAAAGGTFATVGVLATVNANGTKDEERDG